MTKKQNNNKSNGGQNENAHNQNQNEEKDKKKGRDETTPTTVVLNLKVDVHCKVCPENAQNQNQNEEKDKKKEGDETTVVLKVEVHCQGCIESQGCTEGIWKKLASKMKQQQNQNKKPYEEKQLTEKIWKVLKVELHCQRCLGKIGKTLWKTKGVDHVAAHTKKETVTVTVEGTMDVEALVENLKKRLGKKKVVVVST